MSRFLNHIDLNKNEIRNAKAHYLNVPPAATEGQFYYDYGAGLKTIGVYNGTSWAYLLTALQLGAVNGIATLNAAQLVVQEPASATAVWSAAAKIIKSNASGKIDNGWLNTGTGNGIDSDKLDGQDGTYYLARANHTGTQLSATISDLAATVKAYRHDEFAAPNADVSWGSRKITNLLDPTSPQDAATKNYVDNSLQGLTPKHSVRAATTTNIASLTSGAPTVVDGVTLLLNDRILVMNQTTNNLNGIYIITTLGTGSNGTWARTTDANTWSGLVSAYTFIEEGVTYADTGWVCTINAGGTLGTTAIAWTQFNGTGTITGSNVNVGGQGTFKQKTGNNLEFRGIAAASTKVAIALDGANNNVTIDVTEGSLTLNNLAGTLSLGKGGTGAVDVAGAKAALFFVTKYTANIGDGSTLSFPITYVAQNGHTLSSLDVQISIYKVSTGELVYPDIALTGAGGCMVTFNGTAPLVAEYRIVVIG